jgi:hypothetical protein
MGSTTLGKANNNSPDHQMYKLCKQTSVCVFVNVVQIRGARISVSYLVPPSAWCVMCVQCYMINNHKSVYHVNRSFTLHHFAFVAKYLDVRVDLLFGKGGGFRLLVDQFQKLDFFHDTIVEFHSQCSKDGKKLFISSSRFSHARKKRLRNDDTDKR